MNDIRVSVYKAAQLCGVSRNKILRFIREGLVKRGKDNKISLLEVQAALKAEEELQFKSDSEDLNARMKRALVIYREEKAKLTQIKRMQEEGRLVDRDEVRRMLSELGLAMRNKLLGWGNKLPPLLEKKGRAKIAEILEAEIRELLEELSSEGQA